MTNVLTENLQNPKQLLEDAQAKFAEVVETAKERVEFTSSKLADGAKVRAYNLVEAPLKVTRRWASVTKLRAPAERIQKTLTDVREKKLALLKPSIADYDVLNVKQVVAGLEGLSVYDLQKALDYETSNKNRKTVIEAIEKLLK